MIVGVAIALGGLVIVMALIDGIDMLREKKQYKLKKRKNFECRKFNGGKRGYK